MKGLRLVSWAGIVVAAFFVVVAMGSRGDVDCSTLAETRTVLAAELEERKGQAQIDLEDAWEKASEEYSKRTEAHDAVLSYCLESSAETATPEQAQGVCQQAYEAAGEAALADRRAVEAAAQTAHDQAVENAELAYQSKRDALEERCQEAVEETTEPL